MKIHHINCGNILGRSPDHEIAVIHCLLIETDGGLVLVDTGIGTADRADPRRIGPIHYFIKTGKGLEDTALFQIRKLGFSENDVTDIIMTHLDADHTGGIADFPRAKVHVHMQEFKAAASPSTFKERIRYSRHHIGPVTKWAAYERVSTEPWYGFDCVRGLDGLSSDIVMVLLPGHTRGHCGVAIKNEGRWLLHAGDAYDYHRQMAPNPGCPLYVKILMLFTQLNRAMADRTRERLREVANRFRDEVTVFCAHDALELSRMKDLGRSRIESAPGRPA
jgi:glyoxylase-like metal-dependent hydrolase (beta-lactamase superfamily II)